MSCGIKKRGENDSPLFYFILIRCLTKDYSLMVATASLALLMTSGGSET